MGEKYLWSFLILYFPLSFEGLIAKNVLLPLSEAGGGEITGVPLWGVLELEPSIWAEPVGPARFCLSPVGPGLGFRGKNRGVGPEGPALKG